MNAAERAQHRAELRRRYRDTKARELEAHDEPELAEEVRAGRCACGCRTDLGPGAVRQTYVDQRHRGRAHRARLQRAAEAAGVPPRLSLHALEASATRERHGDAPARRQRRKTGPRPGVTVYLPSIEVARRLEAHLGDLYAGGDVLDLREALAALEAALARRRARAA